MQYAIECSLSYLNFPYNLQDWLMGLVQKKRIKHCQQVKIPWFQTLFNYNVYSVNNQDGSDQQIMIFLSQKLLDILYLYIQTNKSCYFAGELVQGDVVLIANSMRQYSFLNLWFRGVEYVQWEQTWKNSEGSTSAHTCQDTYQNYVDRTGLFDFQGKIYPGQYVFPFSLLLPSTLTGSFFHSNKCYIKYFLRVQLTYPLQKQSQSIQWQINVLQPIRAPLSIISAKKATYNTCCCINFGITNAHLVCDKNIILTGDTVSISGEIDNSQGIQKVKAFHIKLKQRGMMKSRTYGSNLFASSQYFMWYDNIPVAAGETREFEFNYKIPNNIPIGTVIGLCVARSYKIVLSNVLGCCSCDNNAYAELELIILNWKPYFQGGAARLIPPQNWNPTIYPKVEWMNMRPFLYQPMPGIQALNQPNFVYKNALLPRNMNINQVQKSNLNVGPINEPAGNYFGNQTNSRQENKNGQQAFKPYFSHEETKNSLQPDNETQFKKREGQNE